MQSDIRKMAQESGLHTPLQTAFIQGYNEAIEAFAQLVAMDCAQMVAANSASAEVAIREKYWVRP